MKRCLVLICTEVFHWVRRNPCLSLNKFTGVQPLLLSEALCLPIAVFLTSCVWPSPVTFYYLFTTRKSEWFTSSLTHFVFMLYLYAIQVCTSRNDIGHKARRIFKLIMYQITTVVFVCFVFLLRKAILPKETFRNRFQQILIFSYNALSVNDHTINTQFIKRVRVCHSCSIRQGISGEGLCVSQHFQIEQIEFLNF